MYIIPTRSQRETSKIRKTANLECTPDEKYEGISKPIDETDVNEQIRRLENETSPGPDGLKKEGIKNMDHGSTGSWKPDSCRSH